jgi:chemotaxis protein methyltransferase CheR
MPGHAISEREEIMDKADYGRLVRLIYEQSGINFGPEKKTMVELRIKRRLRSLKLDSFANYVAYLFGPHGHKEELVHLLDVVSTNKTDFFREPDHFDFLIEKALPELMSRNESGRPLLIWSAGCSTGEEPYTLAMVMSEYGATHTGFRFSVLATDLSTAVLAKAQRGVFSAEIVQPVPSELKRKYFMRSRDRDSNLLRVVPELRRMIEFRRLNFMDADFGLAHKVDCFFCRNVIIYFDRSTQQQIMLKLANQLLPGGYAFVGHSETLHGMNLPLVPIAPALYRKPQDART